MEKEKSSKQEAEERFEIIIKAELEYDGSDELPRSLEE